MRGILQCLKGDIALEQNKRGFDLFYFIIFFGGWGRGWVVKNNEKSKSKTELYGINRISYILQLIPQREAEGGYRNAYVFVRLSVSPSVTLWNSCSLHIFWGLWSIFMKLHSYIPLSKTVCRASLSRAQVKVKGFSLEFLVRSISPEPFDRFSWYFTHMFLLVRRCAKHKTQLPRLEVKVTGQGQRIHPWISCSLHISRTFEASFN